MNITYVDDCITISNSMKDINTFVKSMKDGPKVCVLTDEGDKNKFIGNRITKNNSKHLLRVGWRNFFSSCAVVSVFGSGEK
jgi:hypothetical protein